MWLVDTFDDFKQYLPMFNGAEIIGEYKSLTFKKKSEALSAYYGLFDGEELVAYYWLIKFTSQYDMLHGFELRVREDYQRKGISMFFYYHIIITEGNTIISDYSHNISSSNIWDKMASIPEMKIGTYDRTKDSIEWEGLNKEKVYGNGHMHFVVAPKTIRDIDVDNVEEFSTEIAYNTCLQLQYKNIENKENSFAGRIKPLSLDV
jgi:hypothetical protein